MVEKWVDLDEKSKKKNKKFGEILRVILPKSLQRKREEAVTSFPGALLWPKSLN